MTSERRAAFLLAFTFTASQLASCAGNGARPAPDARGRPLGVKTAGPAPEVRAQARALEKELFGWIVIADLDGTFDALSGHAGAAAGMPLSGGELQSELLRGFGVGDLLITALATDRPLVIALLDPSKHGDAKGPPLVLAVPVVSREALVSALDGTYRRVGAPAAAPAAPAGRPRAAPEPGVLEYELPEGRRLFVHVGGDRVATVVFERGLLRAAELVVTPRARRKPPAGIVVHAALDRLQAAYGPRVQETVAELLVLFSVVTPDPQSMFGMRGIRRAVGRMTDASSLELRLDLQPEGLGVALRMEGPAGGPFAAHVAEQRPGPAWGVDLVPGDAVLVYSTHVTPEGGREDAQELSAFADGFTAGLDLAPQARARWEAALSAVAATLAGELVYGVWPAAGGGIGVGGGYKVADPEVARLRTVDAYQALKPILGRVVAAQLGMDPEKVRFDIKVRRAGGKIQGAPVDLIELKPRFGKDTQAEKKLFKWLFGSRLTLGIATVGDTVVWAAGRDHRARLGAMVRAARGEDVPSIADTAAYAQAMRGQSDGVSVAFVATAGLAHLVQGALTEFADLAPEQLAMLEPFTRPGRENTAIVASTHVSRTRGGAAVYQVESFLPSAALMELGGLGGAMWRVALGPLLGAPALPPLPTPPPAITPPPHAADVAAPPTMEPKEPNVPTGPTGRET